MEALGDVVCCLPICAAVREKHPGLAVIFVTSVTLRPIVTLSTAANGAYGSTSSDFTVRPGYLGLVEKVYNITATDNKEGAGPATHLVDDLAASCDVRLTERQPRLYPPPSLEEKTRRKFNLPRNRPLAVINPGPTWAVRNWPSDSWQTLVNELNNNYDVEIIQIGLKRRMVSSPYDNLKGVRPLMSLLRIDELVALIAMSRLVVSIDSGPIHVAGAVGTPVVGLYGALSPELFLPPKSRGIGVYADVPCLFCHHKTSVGHWITCCANDVQCMSSLTPAVVFAAVADVLGKGKNN